MPQRACNGGFDFKFQQDPYNVRLNDIISSQDYESSINRLNAKIKPARSKKVDTALLITGPLMVPLIPWAIRHSRQEKHRKKLLNEGIQEFNEQRPDLYMRWSQQQLGDSFLSIEPRPVDSAVVLTNTTSRPLPTGLEDSAILAPQKSNSSESTFASLLNFSSLLTATALTCCAHLVAGY